MFCISSWTPKHQSMSVWKKNEQETHPLLERPHPCFNKCSYQKTLKCVVHLLLSGSTFGLKKWAKCRLCTSDVYPCWMSNKNLFKPRMTKTVTTSSNRQFQPPTLCLFSRKQVKIGIFAAKTLFHSSTLETKTTIGHSMLAGRWLTFWGGKNWCIKSLLFFFEEPVCLTVLELNLLNPIVTPKFKKTGNNSWIPRKMKPNRQSTVEWMTNVSMYMWKCCMYICTCMSLKYIHANISKHYSYKYIYISQKQV